jgi:RNA polymerase sigma factor (sigma-70 family)
MTATPPDSATAARWLRWWHEAQTGSPEAMARLLGEIRPFLNGVVQQEVRGQALGPWDGSDVVQECCVKMLLPGHELRGTTGQEFLSWLQTMARNEFRDAVRAGKTKKRGGGQPMLSLADGSHSAAMPPAEISTPSQQAMRAEDEQQLQAALELLSDDHRQVIRLRCSPEKLTWAQIAQRMNRTEDAVKQLFRRGFQRLTKELRGQP